MANPTINFALKSICQQRTKQLAFNKPLPRNEIVSPYNGNYTKDQFDMRRKAEILKYNNNASSSKTNNLSKSQRWAQLVNGNAGTQTSNFPTITVTTIDYLGIFNTFSVAYPDSLRTIATSQYVTDQYGNNQLNPEALQSVGTYGYYNIYILRGAQSVNCSPSTVPTPSSSCNVPGPVTYLVNDETVPLYNFTKNVNAYSYDSNGAQPKKWLFNPTTDILLTNGLDTTVLSLLITDQIDQSSYNFTLQLPFSVYVTGTNISSFLIYDPSDNPMPTPSYFPNAMINLQSIEFGVNYNNTPVTFKSSPQISLYTNNTIPLTNTNGNYLVNDFTPLQFDISFNEGFSEPLGIENPRSSIDVTKLRLVKSTDDEQISKGSPLGPVSTNDYYTAKIYTGVINISNIELLTAPGYVYDFYLQMNTSNIKFPPSDAPEAHYYPTAIQTTSTGIYVNVSNSETIEDNCIVYPLLPTPSFQGLYFNGS